MIRDDSEPTLNPQFDETEELVDEANDMPQNGNTGEPRQRGYFNPNSPKKCRCFGQNGCCSNMRRLGPYRIFFISLIVLLLVLTVLYITLRVAEMQSRKAIATPPTMAPTLPTRSPTKAPTPRDDTLLTELAPITDEELIADESTPQHQAYAWLLEEDTMQLDPTDPSLPQRFALATFFYASGGDAWANNTNWMSGTSECEWHGVTCSNGQVAEQSNERRHRRKLTRRTQMKEEILGEDILREEAPVFETVTRLDLTENNVQGPIPDEILAMSNLQILELGSNLINGTIPAGIYNLTELEILLLNNNSLVGSVSSEIGQLAALLHLDLSFNQLDSAIPTEIEKLTLLKDLELNNNALSGPIQDGMGNLVELRSLFLNNNTLSGKIPQALGNLENLSELFLDFNDLTGEVPKEVCDLGIEGFGAGFSESLPDVSCSCCNGTSIALVPTSSPSATVVPSTMPVGSSQPSVDISGSSAPSTMSSLDIVSLPLIEGQEDGDMLGGSVALSGDGKKLIVSGGSIEVGDGGDITVKNGPVRVYHLGQDGATLQWDTADFMDGDDVTADMKGFSVAISRDGNRVAIGSYGTIEGDGSVTTEEPDVWGEISTEEVDEVSTEEPDESTEEPDGSTEEPDGSTEETDESTEEPEGSTEETDESTEEPEGSTEEPDGSTEEPDGSTEGPEESTEEADESTEEPDGSTEEPDISTEETDESTEGPDSESTEGPDSTEITEDEEGVTTEAAGGGDTDLFSDGSPVDDSEAGEGGEGPADGNTDDLFGGMSPQGDGGGNRKLQADAGDLFAGDSPVDESSGTATPEDQEVGGTESATEEATTSEGETESPDSTEVVDATDATEEVETEFPDFQLLDDVTGDGVTEIPGSTDEGGTETPDSTDEGETEGPDTTEEGGTETPDSTEENGTESVSTDDGGTEIPDPTQDGGTESATTEEGGTEIPDPTEEGGTETPDDDDESGTEVPGDETDGSNGYVRVFDFATDDFGVSTWKKVGNDIQLSGDEKHFGFSLSFSDDGNRLAVGKPGNENTMGEVRVYDFSLENEWEEYDVSETQGKFGWSVSLSGDGHVLAVGAPDSFAEGSPVEGSVVVIDLEGDTTEHIIFGEEPGSEFGFSVSISQDGSTVAVGAPKAESDGVEYGRVKTYKKSPESVWNSHGTEVIGQNEGDRAGYAVALSGNGEILLVGAPGLSLADAIGFAKMYEYSNETWSGIHDEITGTAAGDNMGFSVALSSDGSTAVAGAPMLENSGPGYASSFTSETDINQPDLPSPSGSPTSSPRPTISNAPTAIYPSIAPTGPEFPSVYPPTPSMAETLAPAGTPSDEDDVCFAPVGQALPGEFLNELGIASSTSADGKRIVVAGTGGLLSGGVVRAYEYEETANEWIQMNFLGDALFGEDTMQSVEGTAVSMSGDGRFLAAAKRDGILGRGTVTVYEHLVEEDDGTDGTIAVGSGLWTPIGSELQFGASLPGARGLSVSLSGDGSRLVVGEPNTSDNAGQVHMYNFVLTEWTNIGTPIDGETEGQSFGFSVSISLDGSTFAVGAPAIEAGSGSVSVYRYDSIFESWNALGGNIAEGVDGDKFGHSVSISGDGSQVVIGSPGWAESEGSERGYAAVYKNVDGVWVKDPDSSVTGDRDGDNLGYDVAIAASSANVIAIGAPGRDQIEDETASPVGAGRVMVYVREDGEEGGGASSWKQSCQPFEGSEFEEHTGSSLALSSDGTSLVIGSPGLSVLDGESVGGVVRVSQVSKDVPDIVVPSSSPVASPGVETTVVPTSGGATSTPVADPQDPMFPVASTVAAPTSDSTPVAVSTVSPSMVPAGDPQDPEDPVFPVAAPTTEPVVDPLDPVFPQAAPSSAPVGIDPVFPQATPTPAPAVADPVFPQASPVAVPITTTAPVGTNETGQCWLPLPNVVLGLPGDRLGTSLSISSDGTRLVAGGGYMVDGEVNPGPINVYDYTGDAWSLMSFQNDPASVSGTILTGHAAALSSDGNRLVVATLGVVHVYTFDGFMWSQLGGDITGDAAEWFGFSVAIRPDGANVVVGSPKSGDSGSVSVYQFSDIFSQWELLGNPITGPATAAQFGWSLSVSTLGLIAIGDPNTDGDTDKLPHVGVFELSAETNDWVQSGENLVTTDGAGWFGFSVSISGLGTTVAVGAPKSSANGVDSGSVITFERVGVEPWQERAQAVNGDAEGYLAGFSVALDDNGVGIAVGMPGAVSEAGSGAGLVNVYDWGDNEWNPRNESMVGRGPEDAAGYSVAMTPSGEAVAVGAPQIAFDTESDGRGYVAVFEYCQDLLTRRSRALRFFG